MQIIPSFDLLDGKLVRLRQGDFDQKTEDDATPLELAQELEAAGIRRLHMVDLDGARSGRPCGVRVPAETRNRAESRACMRAARDILPSTPRIRSTSCESNRKRGSWQ